MSLSTTCVVLAYKIDSELVAQVRSLSCAGTNVVRKSKVMGAMKKSRAGYVWRHSFDEQTCQVVTDRPVTDFLEKQ